MYNLRASAMLVALIVVLLLAACAKPAPVSPTPVAAPAPTPVATPAPAITPPPITALQPATSAPLTLDINMKEYQFTVPEITVLVGQPVTINLSNDGRFPHHIFFHGFPAINEKLGANLTTGQTRTLQVTFDKPGLYPFYCPVLDHENREMYGILKVVGPAAEKPSIKIRAPAAGSNIRGPNVAVGVEVLGFDLDAAAIGTPTIKAGSGHWHVFLDGRLMGPSAKLYSIPKDVAIGQHTIRVALHNNDHSPLSPPVEDTVSFSVVPPPTPRPATPTPSPAPPSPTPPVAGSKAPPGSIAPEAVDSSEIAFISDKFNIKAFLARPKTSGSLPGLIIIHENRGLTKHIEDVARRFANQGYVALAPDLLSRVGGTAQFATPEQAVAAIGTLSPEGVIQDMDAAIKYLQGLPYIKKDRIGVIGYCWGGGNSLLFTTRNKELRAAVVYYGPNPSNIDDVANISAPLLGIYGQEDPRITVNVPKLEEAMKKYNKPFEYKVYPGAAHAFFNDTGARYHLEASADAWQRTLSFLEKQLKS